MRKCDERQFAFAWDGVASTLHMNETPIIDSFLATVVRAVRANVPAPWSLPSHSNWETAWRRIEFHGIPFLLHTQSQLLADWPAQLLARIEEEARLVGLWEATHHKAVSALVEELARAGIPSVIMKGTALAYSLHDQPATRRRGDTDLIIYPGDKSRTRNVMEKLGWYRKQDPHGLYYQEGWLHDAANFFRHSIDLHWDVSDAPILQRCLPIGEFFADKTAMPRLGPGAFRPNFALMILHAAINQKTHAQFGYASEAGRLTHPRRLIWSIDFDLLINQLQPSDWERLYTHCERHAVGPLVAEALRGMVDDLHSQLPADTLARLDAKPLDPALSDYLSNTDKLSLFWTDLRTAGSMGERLRLLKMCAFPPRWHLLEKYPSATAWATMALQGRLLLETAQRAVWPNRLEKRPPERTKSE